MKTFRLTLALLALSSGLCAWGAPVVVTNQNVAGESLDADTIKAMFRGKKLSWGNKSPVVVAILKGGPVHDEFLHTAFNISASSFSNYWRLTAMSGGATAPKEFASEDELRKFVAATPGAIGYLDDSNADDSVRKVPLT